MAASSSPFSSSFFSSSAAPSGLVAVCAAAVFAASLTAADWVVEKLKAGTGAALAPVFVGLKEKPPAAGAGEGELAPKRFVVGAGAGADPAVGDVRGFDPPKRGLLESQLLPVDELVAFDFVITSFVVLMLSESADIDLRNCW